MDQEEDGGRKGSANVGYNNAGKVSAPTRVMKNL